MSLDLLIKRRQVEGLYQQLELVRYKQKKLMISDVEKLTYDNISLLEMEEEYLLNKILKLKVAG